MPPPPAPTFPPVIASKPFVLPALSPARPDVINKDRVTGAGVLMLAHFYGTVLHFFDAIERAREMLAADQLFVNDNTLLDQLYEWPEIYDRIEAAERARLAAMVLGIGGPGVPEDQRDSVIQPLLITMLDALNTVCNPRPPKLYPTTADIRRLESAANSVRSRLSLSMTGLTTMQVRDLQIQLSYAEAILTSVARFLPQSPPGPAGAPLDIWDSVSVLAGDRLRADGVDIFAIAELAAEWKTVFDWLPGYAGGNPVGTAGLCKAAAVLRSPATAVNGL